MDGSKIKQRCSELTRSGHRGEPSPPLPPRRGRVRPEWFLQERAQSRVCDRKIQPTHYLGAAEEGKQASLFKCLHLPPAGPDQKSELRRTY